MRQTQAIIDYLSKSGSQGELAAKLMTNGRIDPGMLRPFISPKDNKAYVSVYKGGDPSKLENYMNVPVTHATLRRDEWKHLDEAVLKISETRLGGVQDLIDRGLVYNIGNGLGSTVLETHDISDALDADVTMDGITRGENDRVNYETTYLPLPIIHADYEINARVLAASRNLGNSLDVSMAERAARKVAQTRENMLFTNTTFVFGGGTIYSYVNHPDRNQVTLSVGWDDSAKTSRAIKDEVLSLKQAAINARHYGPYVLYIPTAYETVLDEDYEDTGTTATNMTVRERILKISNILDVKVVDTLPADNVVLVQMTSDVVRLVRGLPMQNVEWKEEGNLITKYKVMAIEVPQVRSDQAGHSGVVHLA